MRINFCFTKVNEPLDKLLIKANYIFAKPNYGG